MKSYCFALAALAAIGLSGGAAFAGEATHQVKPKGPVAMSDSQLDKVTAGSTLSVFDCNKTLTCGDTPKIRQEIGAPNDITIRTGEGRVGDK